MAQLAVLIATSKGRLDLLFSRALKSVMGQTRIADAIIVSTPALRRISTVMRPSHSSNPSARNTIAFISLPPRSFRFFITTIIAFTGLRRKLSGLKI